MFLDEEEFQRFLEEEYDEDEDDYEPDPVTQVFYTSDSPGTGMDCDCCGYTSDLIEYKEFSDGTYHLIMNYGCTGGGYIVNSAPAVGLKLMEDTRGLFSPRVVTEIKRHLTALDSSLSL